MKASLVFFLLAGLAVIEYGMAYPQQRYGQEFDDELPQGYPKQGDGFFAEQQRPQYKSNKGIVNFKMAEMQAQKMECTAYVSKLEDDYQNQNLYQICKGYHWSVSEARNLEPHENCDDVLNEYAALYEDSVRDALKEEITNDPECHDYIETECVCN